MRLAYIVLAHKLPDQVARLVRRLAHPDDTVHLHVDRRVDLAPFTAALGNVLQEPGVALLPRTRCQWGGFGLVQATLDGLDAALAGDIPDYVTLLSGQDYPIAPRAEIERRLAGADGAAFLQHFAFPAPGFVDGGGMDRLERWYLRPSRRWSLPNRYVPFIPNRKVPDGLRPFGGSQFWSLPGDIVQHVQQARAANPGHERFFRRSFVPDESFFQMLVLNGPDRDRVVNDDLRYIDHAVGESHPRLLGSADVEAMRQASDLFARKFDSSYDSEVLDLIDRELLTRPAAPPRLG